MKLLAIIVSIIFTLIIALLIASYRGYQEEQFSREFLESATDQKFQKNDKIELQSKESFGLFLMGDTYHQYKITLTELPQTSRWKPQPRSGFEEGETLEWEIIIDHTSRWGYGYITIATTSKDSHEIIVDVFTANY